MPKPNLEMIKKELNIPKLEPLSQSNYCKMKKIIKNAETLGYVNHYFNHEREVWFDPEFDGAGFLWCSKKAEIIDIKTILKQRILTQLTYYKKHALYYMDNKKIEIIPVHNLPYYLEHQSLTIWFEDDFQ